MGVLIWKLLSRGEEGGEWTFDEGEKIWLGEATAGGFFSSGGMNKMLAHGGTSIFS